MHCINKGKKMRLLVILPILFLSGCLTEETKSRDWYIEHPEEMKTKIDDCKNHAEKMKEADCINALQAERKIKKDKQKELMKKWKG